MDEKIETARLKIQLLEAQGEILSYRHRDACAALDRLLAERKETEAVAQDAGPK